MRGLSLILVSLMVTSTTALADLGGLGGGPFTNSAILTVDMLTSKATKSNTAIVVPVKIEGRAIYAGQNNFSASRIALLAERACKYFGFSTSAKFYVTRGATSEPSLSRVFETQDGGLKVFEMPSDFLNSDSERNSETNIEQTTIMNLKFDVLACIK